MPSVKSWSPATDRLAGFEGQLLNVHVDFPLFQRLALPVPCGRSKIPGIKIQDTRMMRLMEVLLHGGSQLGGLAYRPDPGSHSDRVCSLPGGLHPHPTPL